MPYFVVVMSYNMHLVIDLIHTELLKVKGCRQNHHHPCLTSIDKLIGNVTVYLRTAEIDDGVP